MQSLVKILIPRQLFMLLILSTGLLNHVILIPNLLTAAGRDSWLSVLLVYPIAIFFSWLIYFIVKKSPKEGLFSLMKQRLGRVFSTILFIPMMLFLLTSCYLTLRDLMIWLSAYFLADAPIFMINIILISVCFLVTLSGIKAMAIASGFLLPIVMLLGFFIAFTNIHHKDPSLLFPVLAEGYAPLMKGAIYGLAGLLEIYVVILLQPYSQEPIKFRQMFVLLLILTGLILGPLSAAIMEFGPTDAVNFRYPAYEQWRILSIGEYISNLDFFALYQWLSGALIRVGLFMYLLCAFFTSKKQPYRLNPKLVVVMYLLLFGLMMIKVETFYFYSAVYDYFLPACMVFFLVQILFSVVLVLVFNKKGDHHGKNSKVETTS
ncbi:MULTISPECIES: GerAB/ArcD/ProY family transporter [Neobacillus]|uniref:Endospore germination permease n=1 Tax=Neobacillus rhizophilus TaxID=2833579 RepID=A0A942YWQ7_9BACI|nr:MULTISPECIES: endospore germination permease [Neobacillus]MBS4212941.1 endospore germination permease [Neobacillus rhizophilus]MBU8918157.1 endospore germination permease [Bacillus sp. FJAT-29953]